MLDTVAIVSHLEARKSLGSEAREVTAAAPRLWALSAELCGMSVD